MSLRNHLAHYGIETAPTDHHHCRSGWIQMDCPFCGKDSNKFHLGYRESRGYFSCWKCGRLSLGQTLLALFDITWKEASVIVEDVRAGISSSFEPRKEETLNRSSVELPFGVGPLGKRHKHYLSGRGFDPEEVEKVWKVKGIEHGRISWSLFVPILFEGKVVSWTTRKIRDDVDQRWCSAKPEQERIDHKKILYGLQFVKHSAIIVEGPTDVWNVGKGAVGTFGTGFRMNQVRLMSLIPNRVLCFDNSKDAQNRAQELADLLLPFPGRTSIVQLDAEDPGSATEKEVAKLRQFAGLPGL
jgi:hypothetical protein